VLFEKYIQGKEIQEEKKRLIQFLIDEYPQAEIKRQIEKPSLDRFKIVHFEITENCNLRCIHCYGDFPKSEKIVSLEEYESTLQKLSNIANISKLQITGGEASLVDNLEKYISIGKRYASEIQLFTNGTNLDQNKLKKLEKNGLDKIRITLFSSKPATHNKITQVESSWEDTVNTIKKAVNLNLLVMVETPIMEENKGEIQETKKFIEDIGAKASSRESTIITTGRAKEKSEKSPKTKRSQKRKELCKIPNKKVRIAKHYDNCLWGRVAIRPNLEYFSCVFMRDVSLGKITQKNPKEIEESLKEEWEKYKPDNLTECKNCEFRYLCKRCRPRAKGQNRKEEYCKYSTGEIPRVKATSSILGKAQGSMDRGDELYAKYYLILAKESFARVRSYIEYGTIERFKEFYKPPTNNVEEEIDELWEKLENIKKKYKSQTA